jgi:hypothetical protein
MDFSRHQNLETERDTMPPLVMLGLVLKIGAFIVLLAVGLKLTFWAVDVVDQILHRPDEVTILRPLLEQDADTSRGVTIERDGESVTLRDHNALSLFLLVGLLIVLFGAIGRAIAALITGAVRLLGSIDFKRRQEQRPPG